MPLPLILGVAAAAAAATGVAKGVQGVKKIKDANDKVNEAKERHEANVARFKKANDATMAVMDELATMELKTLQSFKDFTELIEKIQGRPEFKKVDINGDEVSSYNPETLNEVAVAANVVLGGLGGAAAGTAGGMLAAGMTTSAVMALGTASTGTAIAGLSGAAATNATLAAIGGGSLATGGGGIALGTTILGASTLGVGLLVGGLIANYVGGSISDKADEAWNQMKKAEEAINKACPYLDHLAATTIRFQRAFVVIDRLYRKHLQELDYIINIEEKENWSDFSASDKLTTQNAVLLVGLLYNMAKVKLVLKGEGENAENRVNDEDAYVAVHQAKAELKQMKGMGPKKAYEELNAM